MGYPKQVLDDIQGMDLTKPYSTTAAIMQSSGKGKSRLVDEMAKLVFTIPFNSFCGRLTIATTQY